MSDKCKCPPEEPGVPGWVVTYGDMMSLLLTFFILLVSFSSIQESKFKEAMESLQGALGVLEKYPTAIEFKTRIVPTPRQTDSSEIYYMIRKVEQYLVETRQDDVVEVSLEKDGVRIRLKDRLMFASGSAELKPGALPVLDKIADLLDGAGKEVEVGGHTDNVPIHTERYPTNWELSAARAASVARYLQARGIAPERLRAVGYGPYRPLADNATPEGRARNRRVEIFMRLSEQQQRTLEREKRQGLPLGTDEETRHG